MAQAHTLSASARDMLGTGSARAIRREGNIPAILYGDKGEPVHLSVVSKEVMKELETPGIYSRIFDLNLDGKNHKAISREIQFHPVTDRPQHIDFMRVSKTSKVHVFVTIDFINEAMAPGIKKGGMLNAVMHEIEMNCAADSIPEKITIDLTGLDIGDSIHMNDIKLPAGCELPHPDRNDTIAALAAPKVATADDGSAEGEATEEAASE